MSLIPAFYVPPFGAPLYWRDEQSGELPAAVIRYFDFCLGHAADATAADLGVRPLTDRQLQLLCEYCRYWINAPCWERNMAGSLTMLGELKILKDRAAALSGLEDIRVWNDECSNLGIDPF